MKNILQKLILILITLAFIPQSSALSFTNLSFGGTGSVNTGNGYFDDEAGQFNYSGSRNIYTITEDQQIHILEPISYAGGSSGAIEVINSSLGTLKDSVVHNGYLYFVDGTTLKKKKTRSNTGTCESTDTSAGGCIATISTGVGESLRVYNGVLYFTVGTTGFKHLDSNDNIVSDFSICAPFAGDVQRGGGYTVTSNNSVLQVYVLCGGSPVTINTYTSTGNTVISTGQLGNAALTYYSYYTTTNYVYMLTAKTGGAPNLEELARISNSTRTSVDYVSNNGLAQNNRVYVSGLTTIGLMVVDASTYETFNSNEAGISSLPTSEGSGLVSYISKTVDVPNPNYYNDSVIPINVDLKFIISNENHTNYANSLFWHLHARDPTGLEVEDHDLPVVCTQAQPWWDPLGVFTLFIIDNVEPWACDGTQTVQYSRTPGQFWLNGTYEVDLTEQIPGTTSVLATDSWNIVNQSATSKGTIVPPVGGSPDSQNPMKGVTDEFLSSGMMVVFIILIVFAAMGQIIGGLAGAVIGFGGGFLFSATFGLIPMWALFLFAILIITAFAVMMGKAVVGGGQD